MLFAIKKISKFLNKETLLLLYDTMIVSHIRYCISTWYNGNKTAALKIQRIANKFIRMIFKLHPRNSVTNTMRQNNIMTIDQLNKLEIASFMFKYTKNTLPSSFRGLFHNNINNLNQKTRSQSKFFPSYCRLSTTQQSLKYKGPLIWSKIPFNIKQLNSYKKFRKTLLRHLIEL